MTALQPIAGAAGTNGSSAMGTDVWASQGNPGAVTDWGAIINTLVSGGARLLNFSGHDFPYTTQINVKDTIAVTFQGESRTATRLIWKGTGTGAGIHAGGSDRFSIRDMICAYDSGSFTGPHVDCGLGATSNPSQRELFTRVDFTSTTSQFTAKCHLALANAVCPTIRDCKFDYSNWSIRGFETGATTISNDVMIEDCIFGSALAGFIANVGLIWRIDGCTFEFLTSVAVGISSDIACTSTFWIGGGTAFWDKANTSQFPIEQKAANTWSMAVIKDTYFDVFNPTHILLNGAGNVVIEDCAWTASEAQAPVLIDLGTTAKGMIRITGNEWFQHEAGAIANIGAGHYDITIRDNDRTSKVREIRTLSGQERVGIRDVTQKPAIAVHAGQSVGVGVGLDGTDSAMFVHISTAANASIVGAVADITFHDVPSPYPVSSGLDPSMRVPIVLLTPQDITGFDNAGEAVAAQAYVQVTGSTHTGFTVCTKNAIPANKVITYACRVIQL